jgi:hypothetical protein
MTGVPYFGPRPSTQGYAPLELRPCRPLGMTALGLGELYIGKAPGPSTSSGFGLVGKLRVQGAIFLLFASFAKFVVTALRTGEAHLIEEHGGCPEAGMNIGIIPDLDEILEQILEIPGDIHLRDGLGPFAVLDEPTSHSQREIPSGAIGIAAQPVRHQNGPVQISFDLSP